MDTENQGLEAQAENELENSSESHEELDLDLEDESQTEEQVTGGVETPDQKADRLAKELEKERTKNKQLYARLKKQQPTKAPEKKEQSINSIPEQPVTREEISLLTKGYSEEDIKLLRRIQAGAKAEGTTISLTDAANDELFTAYKQKKEKERRAEKAQLGTSRSGTYRVSDVKPGMTNAEHKAAWEKRMGKA